MPPMIMRSHVADSRQGTVGWGIRPDAVRAAAAQGRPFAALGLTPRQTEVLHLLLKGQPNKVIARELKLSVETVKDHVAAVLRTLNVSSRTQAVLAVSQLVPQGAWRETPRPADARPPEGLTADPRRS
jgi:DNA-binding NarL/FixJ family response regulator